MNGRNPSKATVPVYVTVVECPKAVRTRCTHSKRINPIINCDNNRNILRSFNDEKRYKILNNRTRFHATYWMFYPYNEGKGICFLGKIPTPLIFNTCIGKTKTFGNHVGDFEHASISFGHDLMPIEMFLSVHNTGAYYKYDAFSKVFRFTRKLMTKGLIDRANFPPMIRTLEGRPILFVAKGSHGLWSAPGEFQYVRVPRLYDQNGYGIPWKTWKDLRVHRLGVNQPPGWMKYLGRWGNPKSNCLLFHRLGFCEFSDGPPGILGRQHYFQC